MDDDPVIARRVRVRRWARRAQRICYLLYGLAMAVFLIGLSSDFTPTITTITVALLVTGSVVLAPAIIIGYGVRAADRADREDSW